ncbi:MAG: CHASE domain-containing protein [Spongiibacteraceae bacterium]
MTLTLLVGVCVSVLIAYLHYRNNQQYLQRSVADEAAKVADAIERRVELYQYGLRGARGAILTAIGPGLTRKSFRNYSQSRDIDLEFPGARGFGFIRLVAPQDEPQFLQDARADDAPDFTIRQLDKNSGDRFVIQYIEPMARNKAAVGLDIASDQSRRLAAITAMQTGRPILSAPITLVQAQEYGQQSFLFLLPIYRSAVMPPSVSEREESLFGWSYAPLIIDEMLAGLNLDNERNHLTLFDVTNADAKRQFYKSENDGLPLVWTHYSERNIFGRRWGVAFSVHPAYVAALNLVSYKTVFAVGCFISVLLSLLSGILAINRRQNKEAEERVLALNASLEHQVVERTEELARANQLLNQQSHEITTARDRLLLAADVAELGVWSWSLTDDSLIWNDRMFEIYGYSNALRESGVTYEHWRSRVHPDDVGWVEAKLKAMAEERGRYDPVFRVVRPNGSVISVLAGAQIERDAEGKPIRVTGINRDITAQLELEANLRSAKTQADAANAAKSSFLANMSHEIRTPMNAVLGMLQLIQKTPLDMRQRDYIDKAKSAAKSLLNLLNDILDYSKIEAGKLDLDPHPFELEAVMGDLAVVLSGSRPRDDVEVIFDIEPNLPAILIGDSLRLKQVLINLAVNALKFTEQGRVEVALRELNRAASHIVVRVAVTDTGIGIDPQHQIRIFEGFTQAEASTTRRYGGTGLGLAISQRLVALMGGSLQLESEPGRGSRFWFDIPLQVSPQAVPIKSTGADLNAVLRVLVVDDNPVTCQVLTKTMQALGWNAESAGSGSDAVQAVKTAAAQGDPYRMIFMDWQLPDIDGLGAAQWIRDALAGPLAPSIFIMTKAHTRELLSDKSDTAETLSLEFLVKPVTPMQLIASARRALGIAPIDKKISPPAYRSSRLKGVSVLVVEDNILNRQIAAAMLTGEGAQVQLAECGLEGVARVLSGAQRFDVVIMDIQMPDIDGLEATRRIRADARFRELPIVAMTANVSQADRDRSFAAGMNDHIGKPFDLEELVTVLITQTKWSSLDGRATTSNYDMT